MALCLTIPVGGLHCNWLRASSGTVNNSSPLEFVLSCFPFSLYYLVSDPDQACHIGQRNACVGKMFVERIEEVFNCLYGCEVWSTLPNKRLPASLEVIPSDEPLRCGSSLNALAHVFTIHLRIPYEIEVKC